MPRIGLRESVALAWYTLLESWRERRPRPKPEIRSIMIGPGFGEILGVSREAIDYIDESGTFGSVDLRSIDGPYGRFLPPEYVAVRKLDCFPWTVTFRDPPATRFVFLTIWAAYDELLTQLHEFGIQTFDST